MIWLVVYYLQEIGTRGFRYPRKYDPSMYELDIVIYMLPPSNEDEVPSCGCRVSLMARPARD